MLLPAIAAGAHAPPMFTQAYAARAFCATAFQKGYLMMMGVLSPTPSSSYRIRSPECASQNAR